MPFRRFASSVIIDAHIGAEPASLKRNAHRAVFNYSPREGYLYFRSRAISSRCNDNFDMFPADEIKKSYASFIGKPVFVNHQNEDHKRARGVIIDAALHEDRNPDGSPDTWVEVLHELDAKTYPMLAKAILKKEIDRTSMGTDVAISKCSVCHNEATTPLEYCEHIPGKKGKKIVTLDPRTGAREVKLCFEICSGLSFFENSVLVEQPADPTAYFLGPIEHGSGLESLGVSKTASKPSIIVNGGYYLGTPNETNQDKVIRRSVNRKIQLTAAKRVVADYSSQYQNWLIKEAIRLNDDSLEPEPLRFDAFMRSGGFTAEAGLPEANDYLSMHPISHEHILNRVRQAAADPGITHGGMKWYQDAHEMAKTMASHHNVPLQHVAGALGVYSSSSAPAPNFHMASIALHSKRGIYSKPLKDDQGNHVKDENGKKIQTGFTGGEHSDLPGDPMASEADAKKVDKMFSGEHYNDVIGASKTRTYAHLIHNPDNDHDVVVDRHAVAAALGHEGSSGTPYGAVASAIEAKNEKGGGKIYDQVADAYRKATDHINNHPDFQGFRDHLKKSGLSEDGKVKPHQVQALAWIVQKGISDKHNKPNSGTQRDINSFQDHYADRYGASRHVVDQPEHFFGGDRTKQAFLRRALNEVRAPEKVDTLRVESCPICGGTAFDGKQCVVCNYQSPGSLFGDPDVDKAKQLDSLRDQADPTSGLPGGDPDFAADQAMAGDDGTDQPMLACENCGTEFDPSEPLTVGEDPVPGQEEEQEQGQAAAEGQVEAGDVCPVCESGLVNPTENSGPSINDMDDTADDDDPESGDDVGDDGSEDVDEDQDPNKDSDDTDDSDDDDDQDEDDPDADDDENDNPFKKKDKK